MYDYVFVDYAMQAFVLSHAATATPRQRQDGGRKEHRQLPIQKKANFKKKRARLEVGGASVFSVVGEGWTDTRRAVSV
jgi:hypothetical protein